MVPVHLKHLEMLPAFLLYWRSLAYSLNSHFLHFSWSTKSKLHPLRSNGTQALLASFLRACDFPLHPVPYIRTTHICHVTSTRLLADSYCTLSQLIWLFPDTTLHRTLNKVNLEKQCQQGNLFTALFKWLIYTFWRENFSSYISPLVYNITHVLRKGTWISSIDMKNIFKTYNHK